MKRGFLNSSKVKKKPLYEAPTAKESEKEAIQDQEKPQPTLDDKKLPFGKVENRGVPSDYKVTELVTAVLDPERVDYDPHQVVITTIPPQYFDLPPDPDGHSVWIVFGPTKAKVVNRPEYPKALPKPSGPPAYEVRATPNMGMGVFATRDIAAGELIFAERPLLVAPRDIGWMVGMPELRDKYTFLALANNHQEDGSGPLLGIIRTNGYGLDNLFDGPKVNEWDSNVYAAITKVGSRINHSCRPNITHQFDLDAFCLPFVAKRDIPSGEQLSYSYCYMDQSAADRQAELAPYGFSCTCPSCVNATPESDKLRTEYEQRISAAAASVARGVANKSTFASLIDLKKQLVEEGLHATVAYPKLLKAISALCGKLGMTAEESKYLKEMKKYGL
ncbi:SET domain-containing protein [Agrocybe pediades]|nr:SET domain-containing protein [Agrocybe pediades]